VSDRFEGILRIYVMFYNLHAIVLFINNTFYKSYVCLFPTFSLEFLWLSSSRLSINMPVSASSSKEIIKGHVHPSLRFKLVINNILGVNVSLYCTSSCLYPVSSHSCNFRDIILQNL